MKKVIFTFFAVLSVYISLAQSNFITLLAGVSFYHGDYNKNISFLSPSYAFGFGKTDMIGEKNKFTLVCKICESKYWK